MLPAGLDGAEAIELGCGTGCVSSRLARRGARPVGIDNSEAQLATARGLQARHGIEFPLLHGNAERVPRPDAGFDLAISEYGARRRRARRRTAAAALLRDGADGVVGLRRGRVPPPARRADRSAAPQRLAVEELIEVPPPADAITRFPFITLEWARRWPGEEIWKARKLA